jgi:hypothetical protein
MHHTRWLTFGIVAAVAGCGGTTDPESQSSPQPAAVMTTVNIQVDGFKKSRSGAT